MKLFCYTASFEHGCSYAGVVWGKNARQAKKSVTSQYSYGVPVQVKVWVPKYDPQVPVDPICCY